MIIKIKKTLSKNNLNSISRAEDLYLLYEENYKLFETKILLSFKDIKGKENETNNHIELFFSDLELPPIKIIIKTISKYTLDCSMHYDQSSYNHSSINIFPFRINFRVFKDANIIEAQTIDDNDNNFSKNTEKRSVKKTEINIMDKKLAINSLLHEWLTMINHHYCK
ncbi:DUF1249 domain-containing protein [Gammaproteobacteria bacterium]|nr:DUF1249 domain-containing protein [Gammaproteobacteria bacterium]